MLFNHKKLLIRLEEMFNKHPSKAVFSSNFYMYILYKF